MAWYAVHTHAGAETRAVWHLENQGFSVYLPRYLRRRRHARKVDWVPAPLFPRYLFVFMDIAKQRWQAIQSTVGIRYLICNDAGPAEVPEQIIEELRGREDQSGLVDMAQQNRFQPGEKVQVVDGPLLDQIGIFQCRSDGERAVVLLRLLGRDLSVTLPGAALCRAG